MQKRFVTRRSLVPLLALFFAGSAPDVMKPQGRNWEKPVWLNDHAFPPAPVHEHEAGAEHAENGGEH